MEDQVGSGRRGSGWRRRWTAAPEADEKVPPLSVRCSPSEKLLEAAAAVAGRFWCRRLQRRRRRRCSFWEKSHSTKCLRRVGRGKRGRSRREPDLIDALESGAAQHRRIAFDICTSFGRESQISKKNLIGSSSAVDVAKWFVAVAVTGSVPFSAFGANFRRASDALPSREDERASTRALCSADPQTTVALSKST